MSLMAGTVCSVYHGFSLVVEGFTIYFHFTGLHADIYVALLASFPGFPSSFPSLAVRFSRTASDEKLEGKPGNEAIALQWI